MATTDWTCDAEGRANASAAFDRVVEAVTGLLRSHRLGGSVEDTARLIVAQLAHVHRLKPEDAR